MNFDRVDALNQMSKDDEYELCDKFQVPLEARKYLPLAVQLEILGNEPPPVQHLWFWQLETPLMNDGYGEVWQFIFNKYGQNPAELYNNLREILQFELREVGLEDNIANDLAECGQNLTTFRSLLQQYQQGYGNGSLEPHVLTNAERIFNGLQNVTLAFIEKMNKWKHAKRYENEWEWPLCSKIQGWVDTLFDQSVNLRECLSALKEFVRNDRNGFSQIETLLTQNDRLISKIVNSTFLPEINPPRFVKQGQRFPLKYRHWLGRQFFQLRQQSATARVTIINATQYASLFLQDTDHFKQQLIGTKSTGLLQDFETTIGPNKVDSATGHLTIQLPECQVAEGRTNITREPRSNSDTIKNEKFSFLMEFIVRISNDLIILVWTLSQPVIVGSSGSYEMRSLGTVLWDDALCTYDRTTLVVADEMPVWKLINALDHVHIGHVGIPLSDVNRTYLRDRVLRRPGTQPEDEITFDQFCKIHIFGNFTFWEWFKGAINLGEKFFKDMWRDKFVYGFLGRQNVPQLLADCEIGTILLHFSESMTGGLVISWKNADHDIQSAGPLGKSIFENRSLPDSIADTAPAGNFRLIYPNHQLGAIFGRYSPPIQAPIVRRGYVRVTNHINLVFDPPGGNGQGNANGNGHGHGNF